MIYNIELQDKSSKEYIDVIVKDINELLASADVIERTGVYMDRKVDLVSVEIKKECYV